jgi:hypothetical protein
MELQHTPEDWRIEPEDDWTDTAIRVTDVQDVTIATVWRQPYDNEEWAIGNAVLIAAAPDLLAALIDVRDNVLDDDPAMWLRIEAAIAKATDAGYAGQ